MFNFDTDPARLAKAAAELNALNTDLRPLKKRGGKIVQYSGWADQQVNPLPAIQYYETVSRKTGAEHAGFLSPLHGSGHVPLQRRGRLQYRGLAGGRDGVGGEGHGSGATDGRACREWQDDAHAAPCPYPQVARYNGQGSVDEAENFSCVVPK